MKDDCTGKILQVPGGKGTFRIHCLVSTGLQAALQVTAEYLHGRQVIDAIHHPLFPAALFRAFPQQQSHSTGLHWDSFFLFSMNIYVNRSQDWQVLASENCLSVGLKYNMGTLQCSEVPTLPCSLHNLSIKTQSSSYRSTLVTVTYSY